MVLEVIVGWEYVCSFHCVILLVHVAVIVSCDFFCVWLSGAFPFVVPAWLHLLSSFQSLTIFSFWQTFNVDGWLCWTVFTVFRSDFYRRVFFRFWSWCVLHDNCYYSLWAFVAMKKRGINEWLWYIVTREFDVVFARGKIIGIAGIQSPVPAVLWFWKNHHSRLKTLVHI